LLTVIFLNKAVYEWDTVSGKRIGDYVLKNCSYTSIGLSVDGRNTYAVGSDRKLKEISDSQVNSWFKLIKILVLVSL